MDTPWLAPPLIPGDWKTLSLADATAVLARYSAVELARGQEPSPAVVQYSRVRARRFVSAPKWLLLEAEASMQDGNAGLLTFFYGPDSLIIPASWVPALLRGLGWMQDTKGGMLRIVKEYLHLFVNYTNGEAGRFVIVENAETLRELGPDAATPEVDLLKKMVPFSVSADPTNYKGTASVAYSGQLFNADFSIRITGEVEMTDDTPLGAVSMRAEEIRGPFRVFPKPGAQTAAPPSKPGAV
jgi:hypothetical protein